MKKGVAGKAIHRKDYQPYPWLLDRAQFRFEIGDESTRVQAELYFRRNLEGGDPDGQHRGDIELDGQSMELVSLALDGRTLREDEYTVSADKLVVHDAPESCCLSVEVRIKAPGEHRVGRSLPVGTVSAYPM